MNTTKHIGTIKVRQHTFRFVIDLEARNGVYFPELHIYLNGPNGSPAGTGPKGWPQPLSRLFHPERAYARKYRGGRLSQKWTNMLAITIPHISWQRAYKLRKYGAIKLYKLNYKILHKLV